MPKRPSRDCQAFISEREKYTVPIYVTPTFSVCPNHGYISGRIFQCPECGTDTEVYSRVVGYYRPVQRWNHGKQEEFKQRQEYVVSNTI